MKLARDGTWQMWYGMWVSSFVLMPFGVVLTYKANKDSAMFNIEVYGNALKRLLGIRSSRHIFRKEVIIEDPDYAADLETISAIRQECQSYMDDNKLYRFPNYAKLFFAYKRDKRVANLAREMEALIEDLSNSRHHEVLQALGTFPVIYSKAHTTPIPNKRLNMLAGILFPVGIVLWLRIWRFRLRLLKDLKQTIKSCNALETAINNNEK